MMMKTRREFKLGLVGCGRISQSYVQAAMTCPTLKLVGVMDTRPEAARSTGEVAECRTFTDLESFARESGAEGVIICAPPAEHRPIACTLLQAGMHVLCEKPFSTNWEDAVAMVNTATELDLVLMMASKFRYVEDVIRAKAIITSGMLGEIQFYENRFCGKVNMKDRWNSDPQVGGGGVLIDNGTHSVDIVRYLMGPIGMVHAQEGKRIMQLPVEDTVCLSFLTRQQVNGTVYLSWSINVDSGGYINIYGTDGALSIGWKETKYQHHGHPEWVTFGVGYNKVDAFKNQVLNFVETVRGSAEPVITMEDGLASVKVVEAAYQSMRQQNWQEVEEVPSILNLVATK